MNVVSAIVVFAISWWLVLFMTLPFGARPPEQPEKGHAASAPEKPRIALKMAIATGVAILLTVTFAYVVDQGWISFRPPRPDW
jgi:predicted secreted protein